MRRIRIGFVIAGWYGMTAAGLAAGPCASTPARAVKAYEGGVAVEDVVDGFRVTGVRSDSVLGVTWVHLGRCGHPEWPGTSLSIRASGVGNAAASGRAQIAGVKVVRAGDTVRLWRNETNLRMEMAAVSEEGGEVGARIRLRVGNSQADGETVRYVFGLVRGPADVEME